MQLHIRMHLKDESGTQIPNGPFLLTYVVRTSPFRNGRDLKNQRKDKLAFVSLRVANQQSKKKPGLHRKKYIEGEREIRNRCKQGLSSPAKRIECKTRD